MQFTVQSQMWLEILVAPSTWKFVNPHKPVEIPARIRVSVNLGERKQVTTLFVDRDGRVRPG